MEKLTELLYGVSDSYYDFVVAVVSYAKRNKNNLEDMESFIEDHPEALTSDILEFMMNREDFYEHAQYIAGVSGSVIGQL